MTPAAFASALSLTNMTLDSPTGQSCKMVLVDGMSQAQAARATGLQPPSVSRALKQIRQKVETAKKLVRELECEQQN